MKVQAENRCTITKDLFLEGMLRVSRDSYGKFAAKYVLFFVVLWAAFVIFSLVSGGGMSKIIISLVVVVVLSLWICVWTPRHHAKKAWKAQQRIYGDAMERITTFYEDHLEIRGDCAEKDVAYEDIRQVVESKNLILLLCHDRMGVLLSQNGFTRGDADTVRRLIEAKQS